MDQYLENNGIQEFAPDHYPAVEGLMVNFDVSANGEIVNIVFSKSLGSAATDEKLKRILANMPLWTPAKNPKGENVVQKFFLQLGMWGC